MTTMEVESVDEDRDMRVCPICEREVLREGMDFTKDCHGIPYRLVCIKCWYKLMNRGFDGEYYTELDECIDYDY